MEIKEPTAEECSQKAVVFETKSQVAYAIWHPQMGGYCGKAVAIIEKTHSSCIDLYVWHDGEFPSSTPVFIHYCDPLQIVRFGEQLIKLNNY